MSVRRRTALRASLAALTLAVIADCSSPSPLPDPTRSPSPSVTPTTSACVPFTEPDTVEALDTTVTGLRSVPSFRGGDVGADVRLQDGRGLWVFGDTLRGSDFGGPRIVRNSMLLFGYGCASVVVPADRGAVIPDRADGVGYWPMSIGKVQRAGYDLVAVMSQRVRGTDVGAQFVNLGPAIAVFRVTRGGLPVLERVTDLGPDSADPSRPTWGAAVWQADDGWVYVYGTSNPRLPMVFGWALSVARTRPESVEHPETWQYWDGSTWQGDPAKARRLIPAQGGVSQTLSVFERDGRWYAVSKRDEFLGHDLVVWTSPTPTGPFRATAPVAQIPSDLGRHLYRYMPLAHPDLLPRPGHVVVSVSQGSDDLGVLESDPALYRPRFLEIALPAP
jgi:hypothetical protein